MDYACKHPDWHKEPYPVDTDTWRKQTAVTDRSRGSTYFGARCARGCARACVCVVTEVVKEEIEGRELRGAPFAARVIAATEGSGSGLG